MASIAPKWAVYEIDSGWLVDTCAGGTWSFDVSQSTWFDSIEEATEALKAAEISVRSVLLLRVR